MIFVGTHHKTGTKLFQNIFFEVSKLLGLQYFSGWQANLPAGTDVWFMGHSRIDFDPTYKIRGIHVVRHPLNIILSGYRYHRICKENWAIKPGAKTGADGVCYDFQGMSYQQKLNSLSESDGIKHEMRGRSYNAIMDVYRWNYEDSRFLNLRFEDIVEDFDGQMSRAFAWLGLPVDRCLEVAQQHDLMRMSTETIHGNPHVTDKGRFGNRIIQLSPELSKEFDSIYPADILDRLGYKS